MGFDETRIEPIHILLVEDGPLDAQIAMRNFRKTGLFNPVHHVKDGVAALDFLFQRNAYADSSKYPHPGLVLLDLNLPRISGWEVLDAMKADEILCKIPVLVMVSDDRDEERLAGYQPGAIGAARKPLDVDKLLSANRSTRLFSVILSQPISAG